MKQEQFIRIRVKLMEQLRQGAEWSDEEILERIDLLGFCAYPTARGSQNGESQAWFDYWFYTWIYF